MGKEKKKEESSLAAIVSYVVIIVVFFLKIKSKSRNFCNIIVNYIDYISKKRFKKIGPSSIT